MLRLFALTFLLLPNFCLLVLLTLLLPNAALSQSTFNRHYTIEDGLPSNTVYCVLQDSKGYIWFTTDLGVCRYNGQTFTQFSVINGLTDNEVLQIHEDQKGRLWFQTHNGIPCFFLDGKVHNPDNTPFLKKIKVQGYLASFLETPDGSIYIGSLYGMLHRISNDNEVETVREISPGEKGGSMRYLWLNQNQLYSASSIRILRNLTKDQLIPLDIPVPISRATPRFLYDDEQLYAGTGRNLYVWEHNYQEVQHLSLPKDEQVLFLGEGFHSNEIAVGSTHGLRFLKQGSNRFSKLMLPGRGVSFIYRDHEDGLWVSTTGDGVYFAQSPTMKHFNQETIPDLPVNSLHNFRDTIWLGTASFHVGLLVDDSLAWYQSLGDSSINVGQGIVGDFHLVDDAIWVVIDKNAYNRYGELPSKPDLNWPNSMFDIALSPSGQYWIATAGGIAPYRRSYDEWLPMDDPKRGRRYIFKGNPDVLAYEQDSILLIGSSTGVFRLHLTDGRKDTVCRELIGKRISGIEVLAPGRVLVTTYGWGIYLYQDDELLARFDPGSGAFPGSINRVRLDSAGGIWLASNTGLYAIENPLDAPVNWRWKQLNYSSGLLSDFVKDVAFLNDRVYIATFGGITALDTAALVANRMPPRLADLWVLQNQSLEGNANFTSVTLQCDAISFADKNLYYRFSLDDGPWVETESNQFSLGGLAPGNYQVAACVRNGFSTWSNPVSRAVSIEGIGWPKGGIYWLIGLLAVCLLALGLWLDVLRFDQFRLMRLFGRWFGRRKGPVSLTLKTSNETEKVPMSKILWIKSESNYCSVVTEDRKLLVLATLKSFEQDLSHETKFLRVHRSFIVNLQQVTAASRTEVRIKDTHIPVGTTYQAIYQSFFQQFSDKLVD